MQYIGIDPGTFVGMTMDTTRADLVQAVLECHASEQRPGMGGAMLAMVACGEYESVAQCCCALTCVASTVRPEPDLVKKYQCQYEKFQHIYPAYKELFMQIL